MDTIYPLVCPKNPAGCKIYLFQLGNISDQLYIQLVYWFHCYVGLPECMEFLTAYLEFASYQIIGPNQKHIS